MNRRGLVAWVAAGGLLASGCTAALQEAFARARADLSENVTRALSPLEQLQRKGERCWAIRGDTVALAEERALGDAMGVKVAAGKGGLALTYRQASLAELHAPGALKLAWPDAVNARARAVAVVGAGLARHGSRPELPWRFGVLATDEVNAVSAPGGLVLVSRGALSAVTSEDALAGILAHEMAHVVLRHALEGYTSEKRSACYSHLLLSPLAQHIRLPEDLTPEGLEQARRLFGEDTARGLAEGLGLDLDDPRRVRLLDALSSKAADAWFATRRDQPSEHAADALALELLLAAGYRPEEFIRFVGGLPDKGSFFAHHPSPRDRVREMSAHLQALLRQEDPFRPEPRVKPVPLVRTLAPAKK